MPNVFDQFDEPTPTPAPKNIFDQFDEPTAVAVVEPKPVKRELEGGAISDLYKSFASGAGSTLGMVGDVYGLATGDMDNPVSSAGNYVRDYWKDSKSPQLKQYEEARRAAIDAEEGELGKAWAYIRETGSNPALLANAVSEQIPNMLPGGVAGFATRAAAGKLLLKKAVGDAAKAAAAKKAAAIGTAAAVGLGGLFQGADVGGDQYERLSKHIESLPDDQAAKIPEIKQLMDAGATIDEAKAALVLSKSRKTAAIAGGISLVAQGLPNILGAPTVEKMLVGGAQKMNMGRAAGTAVGGSVEAVGEMGEEGGGQLGSNVVGQTIDPRIKTFGGVGETMAQAGIVGGIPGAGAGFMGSGADPETKIAGPTGVMSMPKALADRLLNKTPQQAEDTLRDWIKTTKDVKSIPKAQDLLDQLEQLNAAEKAAADKLKDEEKASADAEKLAKDQADAQQEAAAIQAKDQALTDDNISRLISGLTPDGQLSTINSLFDQHGTHLTPEDVAKRERIVQNLQQRIEADKAGAELKKAQEKAAQEAAQPPKSAQILQEVKAPDPNEKVNRVLDATNVAGIAQNLPNITAPEAPPQPAPAPVAAPMPEIADPAKPAPAPPSTDPVIAQWEAAGSPMRPFWAQRLGVTQAELTKLFREQMVRRFKAGGAAAEIVPVTDAELAADAQQLQGKTPEQMKAAIDEKLELYGKRLNRDQIEQAKAMIEKLDKQAEPSKVENKLSGPVTEDELNRLSAGLKGKSPKVMLGIAEGWLKERGDALNPEQRKTADGLVAALKAKLEKPKLTEVAPAFTVKGNDPKDAQKQWGDHLRTVRKNIEDLMEKWGHGNRPVDQKWADKLGVTIQQLGNMARESGVMGSQQWGFTIGALADAQTKGQKPALVTHGEEIDRLRKLDSLLKDPEMVKQWGESLLRERNDVEARLAQFRQDNPDIKAPKLPEVAPEAPKPAPAAAQPVVEAPKPVAAPTPKPTPKPETTGWKHITDLYGKTLQEFRMEVDRQLAVLTRDDGHAYRAIQGLMILSEAEHNKNGKQFRSEDVGLHPADREYDRRALHRADKLGIIKDLSTTLKTFKTVKRGKSPYELLPIDVFGDRFTKQADLERAKQVEETASKKAKLDEQKAAFDKASAKAAEDNAAQLQAKLEAQKKAEAAKAAEPLQATLKAPETPKPLPEVAKLPEVAPEPPTMADQPVKVEGNRLVEDEDGNVTIEKTEKTMKAKEAKAQLESKLDLMRKLLDCLGKK